MEDVLLGLYLVERQKKDFYTQFRGRAGLLLIVTHSLTVSQDNLLPTSLVLLCETPFFVTASSTSFGDSISSLFYFLFLPFNVNTTFLQI